MKKSRLTFKEGGVHGCCANCGEPPEEHLRNINHCDGVCPPKPTPLRDEVGLVLSGKHLAYGWKRGWLQWAPSCVRKTIIDVWNPVACCIWGHAPFGPLVEEDGTVIQHDVVCTHCCKHWLPEKEQ
jgi:hypothetical protein